MQQLRNEMPLIRWRSNGNFSCPAVVRVAIGGYLTGGAIYHSQCGESIFTHIPGLRVVFPSNALDASGLLRTSIRAMTRYYSWNTNASTAKLSDAHLIRRRLHGPFGKARTIKEGKDLSVITYGAVVPRALQAAQKIERELGVSVELIDLRTLSPTTGKPLRRLSAKPAA